MHHNHITLVRSRCPFGAKPLGAEGIGTFGQGVRRDGFSAVAGYRLTEVKRRTRAEL